METVTVFRVVLHQVDFPVFSNDPDESLVSD